MTIRSSFERYLNYSPLVAASIYGVIAVILLTITWVALANIYSAAHCALHFVERIAEPPGPPAPCPTGRLSRTWRRGVAAGL